MSNEERLKALETSRRLGDGMYQVHTSDDLDWLISQLRSINLQNQIMREALEFVVKDPVENCQCGYFEQEDENGDSTMSICSLCVSKQALSQVKAIEDKQDE